MYADIFALCDVPKHDLQLAFIALSIRLFSIPHLTSEQLCSTSVRKSRRTSCTKTALVLQKLAQCDISSGWHMLTKQYSHILGIVINFGEKI